MMKMVTPKDLMSNELGVPFDPILYQTALQHLAAGASSVGGHAFPSAQPSGAKLHVDVSGTPYDVQLSAEDLEEVFSRYGNVSKVECTPLIGGGNVTFPHFEDAAQAIANLNGKKLSKIDGHLRVTWATEDPMMGMPPASVLAAAMTGMEGAMFPSLNIPPAGAEPVDPAVPPQSSQIRKYTCRFDVGIPNDKEFQVARRIIGSKGMNMKKIVKVSDAKLRLRGRGSGFLEGAQKMESSEPLHLCVSCKEYHGYQIAMGLVTELLEQVYADYKAFCDSKGRPLPDGLGVQMREHTLLVGATGGLSPGGTTRRRTSSDSPTNSPTRSPAIGFALSPNTPAAYPPSWLAEAIDPIDAGGNMPPPGVDVPNKAEIEKLIHERNEARRVSNFAEADRIRMLLRSRGIALMDEPGGRGKGFEVTTWRYWRT
jgi:hypothetical protein